MRALFLLLALLPLISNAQNLSPTDLEKILDAIDIDLELSNRNFTFLSSEIDSSQIINIEGSRLPLYRYGIFYQSINNYDAQEIVIVTERKTFISERTVMYSLPSEITYLPSQSNFDEFRNQLGKSGYTLSLKDISKGVVSTTYTKDFIWNEDKYQYIVTLVTRSDEKLNVTRSITITSVSI